MEATLPATDKDYINRQAVKTLVGTASLINCGNIDVNTVYQERTDWLVVPDYACLHTTLDELLLPTSIYLGVHGHTRLGLFEIRALNVYFETL